MAKKIKYIDNNVIFNDVKEPGIALPSVPISRNNNYTYNGAEDQITGIQFKTINSIDIDWNEAEVEEDIKISTTGQFINWINQKFRSIPETPTWSTLSGKPNFATVATSGSYNDLTDKPNLFDGDYNSLTNKPTIPTVPSNVGAFTNDSGYITLSELEGALGNIDLTNNKTVKDYIDDKAVNSSSLTALLNRITHLENHDISLCKNETKLLVVGDTDVIYIGNNKIHSVDVTGDIKAIIVTQHDNSINIVANSIGTAILTIKCDGFDDDNTYYTRITYKIFDQEVLYKISGDVELEGGNLQRSIEINETSIVKLLNGHYITLFRQNNSCVSVTLNNGLLSVTGVSEGESIIEISFFESPQKLYITFIIGVETKVVGNINRTGGGSYDTIEITGENSVFIQSIEVSNKRIINKTDFTPGSKSFKVYFGYRHSVYDQSVGNSVWTGEYGGGLATIYLICNNGKKLQVNYSIPYDDYRFEGGVTSYSDSSFHTHYVFEIYKTYRLIIGVKATSCYISDFDYPPLAPYEARLETKEMAATIKKSTDVDYDNYWDFTPEYVGYGRLVIKGDPGFNKEYYIEFVEPNVYLNRDLSPYQYAITANRLITEDHNLFTSAKDYNSVYYNYRLPYDKITLTIPTGAPDDNIVSVTSSNPTYLKVLRTVNTPTVESGLYLWISKSFVTHGQNGNPDTYGTWTYPVLTIGSQGEFGTNNNNIEFIYTRNNTGISPLIPVYRYDATVSGYQGTPVNEINNWYGLDSNGTKWTSYPQGASSNMIYEYVSVRIKENNTWSAFSLPRVWNEYTGQNEAEGHYEFRYKVSSTQLTNNDLPTGTGLTDGWTNPSCKEVLVIAPFADASYTHNSTLTFLTLNGKTFLVDYRIYPYNLANATEKATLAENIIRIGAKGSNQYIHINNDKPWYVCSDHPGVAKPIVKKIIENNLTVDVVEVYLADVGNACIEILTAGLNRYGSSTFFVFFSVTNDGTPPSDFSIIGSTARTVYPYVRDQILVNYGLINSAATDDGYIAYTEYIGEPPWGFYPNGEYGEKYRNTLISHAFEEHNNNNTAAISIVGSHGILPLTLTYTIESNPNISTFPSPLLANWTNTEVGFRCAPPYGSDNNPKVGQTSITEFSSEPQLPYYLIVNWSDKIGNLYLFYPIVKVDNNVIKVLAVETLFNTEADDMWTFMCYDYGNITPSYVSVTNGASVTRGMCDFVRLTLENITGNTYIVGGVEYVLDKSKFLSDASFMTSLQKQAFNNCIVFNKSQNKLLVYTSSNEYFTDINITKYLNIREVTV